MYFILIQTKHKVTITEKCRVTFSIRTRGEINVDVRLLLAECWDQSFHFFFSSRKRQRDKDSIIWDDGLYMEPTFTKLDTDDSAHSTYNPIYNLNGGKLEIDSTQAH